jgi:hypothetical protein
VSLPINFKLALSKNSWSVADLSLASCYKVLGDSAAQVTPLGTKEVSKETVDLLKVVSKKSAAGVAYEIIGVAKSDRMVLLRQFYLKGDKLAYELTVENREIGAAPAADFKI